MHHKESKGKVETFFGLFHNNGHEEGPHHCVAHEYRQRVGPSTGMKYLQVLVGEHAINRDGLGVQDAIDLKEKAQKEVVETLHGHNL